MSPYTGLTQRAQPGAECTVLLRRMTGESSMVLKPKKGLSADELLAQRLREVETTIRSYQPGVDLTMYRDAFNYASEMHAGQTRKNGDPYIGHPLEVSLIAAQLRLGVPSLCAALLHDVVEDSDATAEDIAERFTPEIAQIVSGLTKLSKLNFATREEHQAENTRKLIVAMSRDLRVVLIKLADRLHNVRTLKHMRSDKQRRIAAETMDIYAPLASRLGINWMKIELEDIALRYINPDAYAELSRQMNQTRREREEYIRTTVTILERLFREADTKAEVKGRAKNFASIQRKIEKSGVSFDGLFDITAFRVIVPDVASCYQVLGLIHDKWRPVAGRFKDYIGVPKPNGYQSLHTTVIGPEGVRIEVQIRTREMHQVAEHGVAAHWAYKEDRKVVDPSADAFIWLRSLVESGAEIDNSREYLDSVRLDLFEDEVFVFTPNGDVKSLPAGATPVDFAYAVHSEVGRRCHGARVNGRMVQISHELKNGDSVEIITSENQRPRKEWLEFVKSGRAASRIRQELRAERRADALELGRDMLATELKKAGRKLAAVEKSRDLHRVARQLKFQTVDMLLIDIGFAKTDVKSVVERIVPPAEQEVKPTPIRRFGQHLRSLIPAGREPRVTVQGSNDDVMHTFARCCNPVPGEEIVGFVTRGRGLVVHVTSCQRLDNIETERLRALDWDGGRSAETDGTRRVRVKVIARNEPGTLADITRAISSAGIDIAEAHCKSQSDGNALSLFDVRIKSAGHLAKALESVRKIDDVLTVERVHGRI